MKGRKKRSSLEETLPSEIQKARKHVQIMKAAIKGKDLAGFIYDPKNP